MPALDVDLLYLFRLLCDRPKTFLHLLTHFGSAEAVFDAPEDEILCQCRLDIAALRKARELFQRDVEKDVAWLQEPDHHLICIDQPDYPALLKEIHDPPVLLFGCGDKSVLENSSIAMVGSRSPTRTGLANAQLLSGQLSSVGLTIVSGMALGIDAACHQGALLAGAKTIAVLGTGCDIVYPARHQGLAHDISRLGLLLSEFPLRVRAAPHHFPRRNRVVTGLSLGTIVVEAALKSGSLISARCAMEQGREVFAIPGAINNRHARGCHQLIRDGATLVENAQDVLEQLSFVADRALASTPVQPLTGHQQLVASILDGEPQNTDQLEAQLGLSINEVLCALVELEVAGLVVQERGGYVSLKPDDV